MYIKHHPNAYDKGKIKQNSKSRIGSFKIFIINNALGMKMRKYIDEICKSFSPEPISIELVTKHPWLEGIQVFTKTLNSQIGDYVFFS